MKDLFSNDSEQYQSLRPTYPPSAISIHFSACISYSTLPFPFEELDTTAFAISFQWPPAQLQGCLSTWSSVHKYIADTGIDPLPMLMNKILPLWEGDWHKVTFPLFLRLGTL